MKSYERCRIISREIVRSQFPPDGEDLVFCYVSKKGKNAKPGYENYMVSEMSHASEGGWRRVWVRVDADGTCRFDLSWNGERFAASTASASFREIFPGLLKTVTNLMQSREFSRDMPRS